MARKEDSTNYFYSFEYFGKVKSYLIYSTVLRVIIYNFHELFFFFRRLLNQIKSSVTENSRPEKGSGFVLITSLYNEHNEVRLEELVGCLKQNNNNKLISNIYIYYDVTKGDESNILLNLVDEQKITICKINGRPRFSSIFTLANNKFPDRKIIVANSDIYFDNTLGKINFKDYPDVFFVLSRWNDDGSHKKFSPIINSYGLPNFLSADAWIFTTPITRRSFADYELGTMYSDSFLNTQLFNENIRVINPCLEVKVFHVQQNTGESQKKDEISQLKFAAAYKKEELRSGSSDVSTGMHWSFLPNRHQGIIYNNKVLWSKRNIVMDFRNHRCSNKEEVIALLNRYATNNRISIWLYVDDFLEWANMVFPVRCEFLNITTLFQKGSFFYATSAHNIREMLTNIENIYIDNQMIDLFMAEIVKRMDKCDEPTIFLAPEMIQKKIIIDVQYGLSNRLRALASAFSIAKNLGRELLVIWHPDIHCDCLFKDLFDGHYLNVISIDDPDVSDMDRYDYMNGPLRRGGSLRINEESNKNIYIRSAYTLDYSSFKKEEENRFLRSLTPVNEVTDTIDNYHIQNMIGLHIRMGGGVNYDKDPWDSKMFLDEEGAEFMNYWRSKSHVNVFMPLIESLLRKNPDEQFFLAADMQEIYDTIIDKYSGRIIYHKRSVFDRSIQQQKTALIDLYCLSKTRLIYGSNWSSFTEISSRLGNTKVKFSGIDF